MTWQPSLFDEPAARGAVEVLVGDHSAWLLRGYGLHRILTELDCPHMWCPIRHCLAVPAGRLADILALLEHRQRVVILTAVDR